MRSKKDSTSCSILSVTEPNMFICEDWFVGWFYCTHGFPNPFSVPKGVGSLGTRPLKNRKGGSGKSAGVEVYTAPGMQAHFRLAFD